MFIFLAASFGGMQCYVEWQKRRLKMLDQVNSKTVSDFPRNPPSDVIRRSGVFSFSIVGLAFGHLCLMLFFPERSKDEFYYIAKVLEGILQGIFMGQRGPGGWRNCTQRGYCSRVLRKNPMRHIDLSNRRVKTTKSQRANIKT